ncbi:CRTAC1 family protein [Hyphomonas johnsonii]|uniref:Protein containing FG-GAP repeats (Motif found in alpha integrins) n=1 Tax=Hyphomonas johnsonii MHS-2 TaxID=1280950 RepID=A0A059FSP5_9PROT|nr:CRTAC1 family protein [Hyphomonas johnsonii]KCZ93478.1 protein containing FG-GAP repeats (motif found in alpha integrins) [Hyphomonas johnsonii MHS-2]
MQSFVRKWFWFGCGAFGLGTILVMLLSSSWLGFRLFQLEWQPQGKTDLTFSAVDLAFHNRSDIQAETGALPFMAGVVINTDHDLHEDVFLGGGRDQPDGLFSYSSVSGRFESRSQAHDLSKPAGDATMGGVSVDVDRDGWTDLIVARESGVWLYRNTSGRLGDGKIIFTPEDGTTALSIAPGDVNGDGDVDLYVSGYVSNDRVEGQTIFTRPYGGYSYLLQGDGMGMFEDVSTKWGIRRQHNTFTAVFADFDDDGDSDLVVAEDTGRVETWRNDGAPPFKPLENPSVYSYPMGIAAGDFTGDGRLDFYFSNVGHTLPSALLRGDLEKSARFNPDYMLFAGDGHGAFSDQAQAMRAARIGFGWGVVAADFNLDGWEDIAVAQNYAKFGQPAIIHRYAGKVLQNAKGKRFHPVEKRAGAANRLFAIAPLVGDFDGDGLPDLIWANLQGPTRALLNRTPDRHGIRIRLDDSVAAYTARIDVEVAGRSLVRQVVPAQGLSSDSSSDMFVGLGDATSADRVSIRFSTGATRSLDNVAAGQVIDWRTVRP